MCASHDADVRRVVTRLHGRPVLLLYARWAVALNADLASEVLGQHRAAPDDARLVLAPALEPTPRPVPQPIHSNSGCSSTSYGWRPAASSSAKASTPARTRGPAYPTTERTPGRAPRSSGSPRRCSSCTAAGPARPPRGFPQRLAGESGSDHGAGEICFCMITHAREIRARIDLKDDSPALRPKQIHSRMSKPQRANCGYGHVPLSSGEIYSTLHSSTRDVGPPLRSRCGTKGGCSYLAEGNYRPDALAGGLNDHRLHDECARAFGHELAEYARQPGRPIRRTHPPTLRAVGPLHHNGVPNYLCGGGN